MGSRVLKLSSATRSDLLKSVKPNCLRCDLWFRVIGFRVEAYKLSYYNKETQSFTIHPCSGNLK